MTEEKSVEENGVQGSELSPQEDGTKVPLTAGVEAKCASPKGDATIDLTEVKVLTCLTKEELKKYKDDPFWVNLRCILFILFWVGWAAMLVGAIVIIVYAPRCQPPTELIWVQESPMIEYEDKPLDLNKDGSFDGSDFISLLDMFGFRSLYVPDIISQNDFIKLNRKYREDIMVLIEEVLDYWIEKHVYGFIMDDASPEEVMRNDLNAYVVDKGGAVTSKIVHVPKNGFSSAFRFEEFLNGNMANSSETVNWSYFYYDPTIYSFNDPKMEKLVTMGLLLAPGTVIMKVMDEDYIAENNSTLKTLMQFRDKQAVRIGGMEFANRTENVVAYVRIYKGIPGYAVVLNMGNANANVSLSGMKGVGDTGTLEYTTAPEDSVSFLLPQSKMDMWNIEMRPYEGSIIQFVPSGLD